MEQEHYDIKTPEYISLRFELAGLGSRSTAFIIDSAITIIANLLLILFLFFGLESSFIGGAFSEPSGLLIGLVIIGIFLINMGYYIILEYFWGGRTIGKRILHLRTIQDNGHRITLLSSIIRNFLRLVDSLPSGYLVGILLIFFHQRHKRLGDIAAGTIVVHEHRATKKEKKLDNEIRKRGLVKEQLAISSHSLKQFDQKDWHLLQTYCNRIIELPTEKRVEINKQIGDILLPKLEIDNTSLTTREIENNLFILFLHLREEWDLQPA